MKKAILALAIGMTACFLQSCGENKKTDVVESGTYTGKAEEVDKGEKEIYVRTSDGKLLELYFTDQTKLTQGGQDVQFDALQEGGQVSVQVEKQGNKDVPLAVEIL